MLPTTRGDVLGKIAGDLQLALERRAANGTPGSAAATRLDGGEGWSAAVVIAAAAIQVSSGSLPARDVPSAVNVARITESVRRIEAEPGGAWTLARLAADARQSPFHYLRTFQKLAGVTPHQFILRARVR